MTLFLRHWGHFSGRSAAANPPSSNLIVGAQHPTKDFGEVDASAVYMREGDVGFVENQRQIRTGQKDSVYGITLDQGLGEAGEAVAFRVSPKPFDAS